MFDWLQKLTNSKKTKNKKEPQIPAHQVSKVDVNLHKKEDTIFVRGQYWKNTEEDRWELPDDLDILHDSSMTELIEELERIDRAEIRRKAAQKLGSLGHTANPAIPGLMKVAVDKNEDARNAALVALNAIDPNWTQNRRAQRATPYLIAAFKNQPTDVINTATNLLIQIGEPTAPDLIDEILNNEDNISHVYVLRVLSQIDLDSIDVIPALIKALHSQHLQVRIAAAETLAIIGPTEETIPELVKGLGEPFPKAREAMAKCLGQAGNMAEPALPALIPLLADRQAAVRHATGEAISLIGPETIPSLIELISTYDLNQYKAWLEASQKVSKWYMKLYYPKEEDLVSDPCKAWMNLYWTAYDILEERECLELAQEMALSILGTFAEEASHAVPIIIEAADNDNANIRAAAVQALGQIGHNSSTETNVVAYIIPKLVDRHKAVRDTANQAVQQFNQEQLAAPAAVEAIGKLSEHLCKPGDVSIQAFSSIGAAAVPTLIDVLTSGKRVSRQNAAIALGSIGPSAYKAIPVLKKASEDDHLWVQAEAKKALIQINGQGA